jgi:NAD(P)H dehydrogenase (quinone)
MADFDADNRYDRIAHDIEAITGRPALTIQDFVAKHSEMFDVK